MMLTEENDLRKRLLKEGKLLQLKDSAHEEEEEEHGFYWMVERMKITIFYWQPPTMGVARSNDSPKLEL